MRGRTVILVSHHVALCAPGADYIVALENGSVQFQGESDAFMRSSVLTSLVQSTASDPKDEEIMIENLASPDLEKDQGTTSSLVSPSSETGVKEKKPPRVLIEEEKRAVGRINHAVWETYIHACGDHRYWIAFALVLMVAALAPVAENKWLE
jgi:ABC-type glutathione transport system ATPase component